MKITEIADRLQVLTKHHGNWGFMLWLLWLRNASRGFGWNHKRVYQIYCELARCDNGLEYVSELLAAWAEKRGISLQFIQQGKPQQNAYAECYSRTGRYN